MDHSEPKLILVKQKPEKLKHKQIEGWKAGKNETLEWVMDWWCCQALALAMYMMFVLVKSKLMMGVVAVVAMVVVVLMGTWGKV